MTHLGLMRLGLSAAPILAALATAFRAGADEPVKVTEPPVMRETAEITSVVDAFDDQDKFDLHLSLGFQQTWRNGNIRRESASRADSLSSGNFTSDNLNVAKYSESTSRLNTRADIGLFKDIALVFRVPIILSNDRKLEDLDGSEAQQSVVAAGVPGEQLFRIPFESPTRSGIEYLAVGLDVAPMNQARDFTKPTWVIGIEGRFSVSEPLHACRKDTQPLNAGVGGGQVECADQSDIDRDGVSGEAAFQDPLAPGIPIEGTNFAGDRDAGVSRGTTGLQIHTYLSKRVKYVEPYGGFEALFEFQNDGSDYGGTDLEGALVNHPPFEGSMIAGIAVIPWEVRDQFQRIELDFRFKGSYRTEGRDYSPLFDALGSSDAQSLRRPNFASFRQGPSATFPSVADPNSQRVFFTGITDVQQHGIGRWQAQFTFQAGEYVKFNLGAGFTVVQGHVITFDQPCNPDFSDDLTESGPCRNRTGPNTFSASGVPNPNYRPAINVPGRRFRYEDGRDFDAWLNATVMF